MNPELTLQKYFGFDKFRPGQLEIVTAIIEGKDTLALLPTGGGKSICFQVPGLIFDGITLVISPLISLMQDQVNNLLKKNIAACCIHSGLSAKELEIIFAKIARNCFKFVYVAPERLINARFIKLCKTIKISQIVVDEAHCISMWGHDFRPAYKSIAVFASSFAIKPIISAFTATATEKVNNDIISSLQLTKPAVFTNSFSRTNLKLFTYHCWSTNQKIFSLLYILNKHQNQTGIIYTATRDAARQIVQIINNFSWSKSINVQAVDYYHGALDPAQRKTVQEKFLNNEIQVIVATNAFGMGIDKPNIRFVIHYQIPGNIENFYQEIGRAGRDGENSDCYLLFFPDDVSIQKEMILSNKQLIKSRKIFLFSQLNQMIKLAHRKQCLHKMILKYFGEINSKSCLERCNFCTKNIQLKIEWDEENILSQFEGQLQSSNMPNLTQEQLAFITLLKPRTIDQLLAIPGLGNGLKNHFNHDL